MGDQIAHNPTLNQTTEEIREAFRLFDLNRDGSITREELKTVMTILGQVSTDSEICEALRQVDGDGNGTIEFEEFRRCVVHEASKAISLGVDDIVRAFHAFDKDKNGFISGDELFQVLLSLGEVPSNEDVLDMIKQADHDGDGLLNFAEFCGIMMGA